MSFRLGDLLKVSVRFTHAKKLNSFERCDLFKDDTVIYLKERESLFFSVDRSQCLVLFRDKLLFVYVDHLEKLCETK